MAFHHPRKVYIFESALMNNVINITNEKVTGIHIS